MRSRVSVIAITVFCFLLVPASPAVLAQTSGACLSSTAKPWYKSFTPKRTFYVSPNGTGNGTTGSPMSVSAAMAQAAPGDLYWLKAGTYPAIDYTFTRSGTCSDPIVWRGEGHYQAKLNGTVTINGNYIWVWGLDITDPNDAVSGWGIEMNGTGTRAINNHIHHHRNDVGLSSYDRGPGHIVYGNIFYWAGFDPEIIVGSAGETRYKNPHNMYFQNNYNEDGMKYIVNNMAMDAKISCATTSANNECHAIHAYTASSFISGLHIEKNIIKEGAFMIGGVNDSPDHHNTVNENYTYITGPRMGYNRESPLRFNPMTYTFTNNYVGNGRLHLIFWGQGETQFTKPHRTTITGNTFVEKRTGLSQDHMNVWVGAYVSSGPTEAVGLNIDPQDIFDNNTYLTASPFQATLHAGGSRTTDMSFSTWKSRTAASGKAFDVNSTTGPAPTQNKVAVLANDYEPGRANVALYNWSGGTNAQLDLSSVLPNNTQYAIYDYKNAAGTPIKTGTYTGPVSIPTNGQEFIGLLVVATNGTVPTPSPTVPTQTPTPHTPPPSVEPSPTPSPVPGDANGDRLVDGKDYVKWLNNYQRTTSFGASEGDFDNNGTVDGRDYVIWVNNYTQPNTSTPSGTAMEAEQAQLVSPMVTGSDTNASGGSYVNTTTGSQGTARFTVNITEAGTYSIWARHLSPNSSTDSFFVSVDNGVEDIFDTAESKWSNNWQWTQVNGRDESDDPLVLDPRTFNLSAGQHTITFRGRDANTKLDQIVVSKQKQ